MSTTPDKKVKDFYKHQSNCESLKWTRDANRLQRAVCVKEGNAGGACKYNLCLKVKSNKQS